MINMEFGNYDTIDITFVKNPFIMSVSELAEEYKKLSTCYLQQKNLLEHLQQHVHTLNQDKIVKDKILNQELQMITENYDRELNEITVKHSKERTELQKDLINARKTVEKLELENQSLKEDLKSQMSQLHTIQIKSNPCLLQENDISKERLDYLTKIETYNAKLTNEIVQLKLEKSQLMLQITQEKNEIEEIKEMYECSQQNLKYKTEALQQSMDIIDSLQEKIVAIENELLSYKNKNFEHNIKGNSLFSEVDDQRKVMREALNHQKLQYQSMKIKYEQSASEINRLKRENSDILNELKEVENMFKAADKFNKSSLIEQIGFLKTENSRLYEKLKHMQLEMEGFARAQGVNWLSSMLEYCENETKDLNAKLMCYGMKKCEAEGLYVQAQERAAKWRFEALKSRCIIRHREILLENNNISFDSKLANIRQMVEKKYGSNENPNIDVDLCSIDDNLKQNNNPVFNTTIESGVHRFSDNTIVMIPDENSVKPPESDLGIRPNSILQYSTLPNSLLHENKNEEVPNKELFSNTNVDTNVDKSKKSHLNSSTTSLSRTSQHIDQSELEIPERTRHINVEMFTVTLKRKDTSKEHL